MFFILSKVLWFVFEPSNFLAILVFGLACGAAWWRPTALSRAVVAVSLLLLVGGFSPVGAVLTRVLEDRFPMPPAEMAAPDGIVVLGGSVDEEIGAARGRVTIANAADRLTAGVILSRRFPAARLVFTGGSNALLPRGQTEAADTLRLWTDLGVPAGRIELEDKSRNTYENAAFTYGMVRPKPGERWLLVTSAAHMPRAMGLFRKVGWSMDAYPVDYTTFGTWRDLSPPRSLAGGLSRLDGAMREWVGLAAYFASGRMDTAFPGP